MGEKIRFLFLAVAVIAIAIFFRFWNLAELPPGLYPDEAMNGSNALEALAGNPPAGGWKVFYPENNGREGLFINIQSLSVAVLGATPLALRLPAAIFGTLTVLGLLFLTRLFFHNSPQRDRIALLAAFFIATSFWHINFSRMGFRAITAPFFLVWGLYFFFRFYGNIGSGFSQHLSAAVGGILFGLGFHSYIAYRITPLLFIPLLITGWRKYKEGTKRNSCFPCLTALFVFFAFLAFAPLGIYFISHPEDFLGRTSQISIFSSDSPLLVLGENIIKTLGMFWVRGDGNWRHNLSGAPQLFWPVGIFFLAGLITMLRNLKRRDENHFISFFLLFWLFLLLLPALISAEGIPHALRFIIVIPPVMIISAVGLDKLAQKVLDWLGKNKDKFPQKKKQLLRIQKELKILFFMILIAVAVHAFNQYFFRWARSPEVYFAFNANYRELADKLNSLPRELPKYVVVDAGGVDVRGIPMPAQTIMFLTGSFLPEKQREKNIFYILPGKIPYRDMSRQEHLFIALLEPDGGLREEIQKNIPYLKTDLAPWSNILIK